MITTLNKIRAHFPCQDGWAKLLLSLGKTKADEDPLAILTILESNGLNDALWCLRAVDNHDQDIQLYTVWNARQVQHLMNDPRSLTALDVAERFANGEATAEELTEARSAAWTAAREEARAAEEADVDIEAWSKAWSKAWAASAAATSGILSVVAAVVAAEAAERTGAGAGARGVTRTNKLIEICTKGQL